MAELEARKLKCPNTGTEALLMGILVEGRSITQISTYGKMNFPLQDEHTKGRIWSSRILGGIPFSVVIIFLHHSLKTVLFPVLYIAMGTDANEATAILLPSNITIFILDFSGSGLSDGDYVSLGWHENQNTLKVFATTQGSTKEKASEPTNEEKNKKPEKKKKKEDIMVLKKLKSDKFEK